MGFVYMMVYLDVGSLYWFYFALLATCVSITCYCVTEEFLFGGVVLLDDVESSVREGLIFVMVDLVFLWCELVLMYMILFFVLE